MKVYSFPSTINDSSYSFRTEQKSIEKYEFQLKSIYFDLVFPSHIRPSRNHRISKDFILQTIHRFNYIKLLSSLVFFCPTRNPRERKDSKLYPTLFHPSHVLLSRKEIAGQTRIPIHTKLLSVPSAV